MNKKNIKKVGGGDQESKTAFISRPESGAPAATLAGALAYQ
jgi:hypothetical protein